MILHLMEKFEPEYTKERLSKALFDLSEDNQRLCAAFCLKEDGKVDYDGHVTQEDADALLSEWKTE